MPNHRAAPAFAKKQDGALILITLLILLVVSMLGMSTVDSTGLEMQMADNSRDQQLTFEAAEYTLAWVENNIRTTGFFTSGQVRNDTGNVLGLGPCGSTCFTSACTNGYCFNGSYTLAAVNPWECTVSAPTPEPFANAAIWATNSGKHRTLAVPNTGLTTKYIIEFYCFTARNPAQPLDGATASRYQQLFRITAYAVGPQGSRVMLRSSVKGN